jgi:hypothetical protein
MISRSVEQHYLLENGGVMKRWMVGAATVLAAVGGLAAPGLARASSDAWYKTYQAKTPGVFWDVAAVSKTNIWAVGDLSGKKGSYRPFIQHHVGRGWKTVTIPGSPKFQSSGLSASAANNVWVYGPTSTGDASLVYRYDGSHWHKIPLPAETSLWGAVTLGPRDVWAFGSSATIFAPGVEGAATIYHWNGSKWRGYGLARGSLVPTSISASATNNVWIAGFVRGDLAQAYRWNGKGWSKAAMPRVRTDDPSVTAFSPSNVWISWNTATASHVTHWTGRHWRTIAIPGDINANTGNIVPDGNGGYWFGDQAILGNTWTSEPGIEGSGGLGPVVHIPGTESVLQPSSVENSSYTTQWPAIYRFDL